MLLFASGLCLTWTLVRALPGRGIGIFLQGMTSSSSSSSFLLFILWTTGQISWVKENHQELVWALSFNPRPVADPSFILSCFSPSHSTDLRPPKHTSHEVSLAAGQYISLLLFSVYKTIHWISCNSFKPDPFWFSGHKSINHYSYNIHCF